MGSLTLHRSVNGELPSLSNRISVIFSGDQGDDWLLSETKINAGDLSESDGFEVSFLFQHVLFWYNTGYRLNLSNSPLLLCCS